MRLSRNEIWARVKSLSKGWRDTAYEKGETQSFYNDLFHVFGKSRHSVATYEEAKILLVRGLKRVDSKGAIKGSL